MKPSALIIHPRKYFYVQYLHTFPQFMQAGPIKDNISASCTMLTSLVYYKYKNAVTGVICTFVLCLLAWQIVHDIMGKGIHSVKILGKNPIHNDLNLVIRFFFLSFFLFSLPLWNGTWGLNLCGQKEHVFPCAGWVPNSWKRLRRKLLRRLKWWSPTLYFQLPDFVQLARFLTSRYKSCKQGFNNWSLYYFQNYKLRCTFQKPTNK